MRCFDKISTVLFLAIIFAANMVAHADDLARLDLPASWKLDAELTDMFFLNEQLGWAVGAQGVILKTIDGGKNWSMISTSPRATSEQQNLAEKLRNLQPMNELDQLKSVRCRFESIHFVDAKHGWVAGGFEYPCVERSRSVVMTTSDGGQTWKSIHGLVLPRIAKIRFHDRLSGWAIGDRSNLYQTGVFKTEDGGVTWTSFGSGRLENWIDGESSGNGFVLLNEQGQIHRVTETTSERGVLSVSPGFTKEIPIIRTIKMIGDSRGIAAGSTGTILLTQNDGLSWKRAEQFEQPWLRHFDFRDITVFGNQVWLVGDPGCIAISIDQTTSEIKRHALPTTLPLNKLAVASSQTICAAGALGTVVYSNNAGEHWKSVRGLDRVALMNVFDDMRDVPLSLIAKYSSEEGFVSSNVMLNMKWAGKGSQLKTLQQATERIGSSQCCEIAVQSADDAMLAINELAKAIRVWRPSVVSQNRGSLVEAAIKIAADSESLVGLAELGLKPWQVRRIGTSDDQGELTIERGRLLPRSGDLVEDHIAVSRGLVGLDVQAPEKKSYRMTGLAAGARSQNNDLLAELERFGEQLPKRNYKGGRGNLISIQHTAQKHKQMRQLMNLKIENPQDALNWRKNVQNWIGLMREETAGVWVVQLAQEYLDAGQPELAAQTVELLANRWPDHAFGPLAMTWLIRYYASDEFGRLNYDQARSLHDQLKKANDTSFGARPLVVKADGVTQTVWVPEEEIRGEQADEIVESLEAAADTFDLEQYANGRRQAASLFLTRLRQRDPDLVLSPQYRLIETVLTRNSNGFVAAQNLLGNLAKDVVGSPETALAAKREIQIHESGEALPPNTILAYKTDKRPYLDGTSDDEVWKTGVTNGNVISRKVDERFLKFAKRADSILFSHDDEFLYVLVRCNKIRGQAYGMKADSKEPDADLTNHDRVEFTFDTDRDYGTAMQLTVDHRGLAADRCAGCAGWNPDWFIAKEETEQAWTVELAIPLKQLSLKPVKDSTWAVGLRRLSYDSKDLWADELHRSDWPMEPRLEQGLQSGLKSHANLFLLLKFE